MPGSEKNNRLPTNFYNAGATLQNFFMPLKSAPHEPNSRLPDAGPRVGLSGWLIRAVLWGGGAIVAGIVSVLMVVGIALAVAFPNLPDISDLSNYRPVLPLRVFSSEGILIGEFGEERRKLTPIKEIPKVMIDAVLAIEDTDFYAHSGVSYKGFVRAPGDQHGKVGLAGVVHAFEVVFPVPVFVDFVVHHQRRTAHKGIVQNGFFICAAVPVEVGGVRVGLG